MRKFKIICFVVLTGIYQEVAMSADVEDPRESIQESIDYAIAVSHRAKCVLTNGYVCVDTDELSSTRKPNSVNAIPGVYLSAWQVCYEHFKGLPDLSEEQKRLEHYQVGFAEDKENYIIEFGAHLLPKLVDGEPHGVILGSIGRSAVCVVNKRTLKISKWGFLK